jgi:hypothetical protein
MTMLLYHLAPQRIVANVEDICPRPYPGGARQPKDSAKIQMVRAEKLELL